MEISQSSTISETRPHLEKLAAEPVLVAIMKSPAPKNFGRLLLQRYVTGH